VLDFTKSAKRYLAINLIDNQLIRVRMPTKRVFDALLGLKDHLTSLTTDDGGQLGDIYDLIAVVLSNNLEHKPVTSDYLAELFDIEDVQTFFQGYMAFISGVVSVPNAKSPPSQTQEPSHTTDA
jgi:hypothetical protein